MYFALQFEKEFLFSAILSFLAQQLCFPKAPTKMDFIRSFFLGTEKISLTSFPSDWQLLSAKWGTPLSQRLTNSLLHWPVQQATYLQRESLKQLCHHLAGQLFWIWVVGYLIFFFFFLLILFVSHLSLVYKQLFSGQKAVHKLFTEKSKAKQGVPIFRCLFVFSSGASAGRWNAAGRRAGSPPPLPSSTAGWWLARRQRSCADICQLRTWTRPSQSMAALSVSTASGCVLISQKPARDIFV